MSLPETSRRIHVCENIAKTNKVCARQGQCSGFVPSPYTKYRMWLRPRSVMLSQMLYKENRVGSRLLYTTKPLIDTELGAGAGHVYKLAT